MRSLGIIEPNLFSFNNLSTCQTSNIFLLIQSFIAKSKGLLSAREYCALDKSLLVSFNDSSRASAKRKGQKLLRIISTQRQECLTTFNMPNHS